MEKAVHSIGYELITTPRDTQDQKEGSEHNRLKQLRRKTTLAVIFSIPVFLIAMFFHHRVPYANWIMMGLSLPVMVWFGREFFVIAWKRTIHLSTNMDTLVAMGTGVAFLFSAWNTIFPDWLASKGLEPHVWYETSVVIICQVNAIVLDKTGTITKGKPEVTEVVYGSRMPDPESRVQFAKAVVAIESLSEHPFPAALVAVADAIQENSAAAITGLKAMGMEVHMLTGDSAAIATQIVAQAGIDFYKAEATPVEKSNYSEQ